MTESFWYKDAVFYELNVRAFRDSNADGHGDLNGALEKLDYIQDLGITCIWLLPTYPSPLVDDGYDIADYYGVHPDYGVLEDFEKLIGEIHKRGMRIITDLVLNHTSDQHPWFQAARADRNSPYREYYVWSDTDRKYLDARVIFNDSLDSNWTWDETAGQYYWHRFYPQQPDLNFDNPAVQEEMFKIASFWLDLGIDGFRADAVPYLFEREGTNCDNLPETHAYLKKMRQFIDTNYPGRILLMEANQWPEEVLPYFGDGDEAQMAFHFPIMPRLYMALHKADRSSIVEILALTPQIPDNCQWCTFLRNHDELTLEMVTEEERQWMWQEYAPEPRMRLNLGIRRRLAPLLGNDRRKIELLNVLLFSLPGSPVIYYGDEIGMGDNIWLDDRGGVRTPMQWDDSPSAGFSEADPENFYAPVVDSEEYASFKVNVAAQIQDPDSLFHFTKNLIQVRKSNPFLAAGKFTWAEISPDQPAAAAFWRSDNKEHILAINNLSDSAQSFSIHIPSSISGPGKVVLGEQATFSIEDGRLDFTLSPYAYVWIKFE